MLSTTIIYRQTQFGLDQGLRFDKDQLLIVDVPSAECEKILIQNGCRYSARRARARPVRCFSSASTEPTQYLAPDGREVTLATMASPGPACSSCMGLKPLAGTVLHARS